MAGLFDRETGQQPATSGTGLFGNSGDFLTKERAQIKQDHQTRYEDRTNPFRALGGAMKTYNLQSSPEVKQMEETQTIMEQIDVTNQMEVGVAYKELMKIGNVRGAIELLQQHKSLATTPAKRDVTKGADGYNYYTDTQERVLPDVVKTEESDKVRPSNAQKMMRELIKGDPDNGVEPMSAALARKIAYNTIKPVTDPTTGSTVLYDEEDLTGQPMVLSPGDRVAVKFQTQLKDFGNVVEKSGISQQEFNLREVEKLMFTEDAAGNKVAVDDIPGFGQTGMMPTAALSDEGKKLRQALATVQNITLKDRSGAAVTIPEFERFKKEFSQGAFQTDKALANAMLRIRRIFDQHKQSLSSGYMDNVVKAYSGNSGISFRAFAEGKKSGGMVRREDGSWGVAE
jgi:hypothetical protein